VSGYARDCDTFVPLTRSECYGGTLTLGQVRRAIASIPDEFDDLNVFCGYYECTGVEVAVRGGEVDHIYIETSE
jgi:hypothetical protein